MSLITLPVEVLTIIIRYLDTKSIYILYKTSNFFRNIIRTPGVVRRCRFSLSTLATVKSFNLDFSRDISGHLKSVNLSGVPDLAIEPLLLALEYLRNLEELDVTYTKILMLDYLDIAEVRPTLKSLAINFMFGQKKYRFTTNHLMEYQEACKGLENVHFVGSKYNLLYGEEAIIMLNKANLRNYRLTIMGEDYVYTRNSKEDDDYMRELEGRKWKITVLNKVSRVNIYFVAGIVSSHLLELPILKLIDINKFELLKLQRYIKTFLYASPLLKEFISENFDVKVEDISEIFSAVVGEANVMLWNKERIQFDCDFFSKLSHTLKEHLAYSLNDSNLTPVPTKYKWYRVEYEAQDVEETNSQSIPDLNFDSAFNNGNNIKLKLRFNGNSPMPVAIDSYNYIKRLTHFIICGNVNYSPVFFDTLFENCDLLETLEIVQPTGVIPVLNSLKCLPKCKSLKNIQIKSTEINYLQLFGYLSECKNIENIHLSTTQKSIHPLPNPTTLFRKCDNLYSLYIQVDILGRSRLLEYYQKVRSDLGRDCLSIQIDPYSGCPNRCNPYFSVFNVYELLPKDGYEVV